MERSKINVLYKTKKEIKQKMMNLDDLFVMIRGEKYQKQCNCDMRSTLTRISQE